MTILQSRQTVRTVLLALVAIWGAFGGGASTGFAQADDAAGFQRELTLIRRSMGNGKWRKAAQRFDRMLETHAKARYVLDRRDELIGLHRECAFRVAVGEVDPDKLISGELVKWKPATGQIELRYTPKTMGDFEKGKSIRWHPVTFCGPHTVSIKGKRYPAIGSGGSPTIYVCTSKEAGFLFTFGFRQSNDEWMPARLFDLSRPKDEAKIAEKEITLAKSGKPFLLKVKVTATQAKSYFYSRPLLKTKKPADQFGYCGIEDITSFDEIVLEGKIEPAWIQGKVDAFLTKRREAFEKSYDVKKALPAWLSAASGGRKSQGASARGAGESADAPDYPQSLTERQRYYVDRFESYFEARKFQKAARFVVRQSTERIPEPTRSFLIAKSYLAARRPGGVVDPAKKVRKLAPDFWPATLLLAEALAMLDRADEAGALYAELAKSHPREPAIIVGHAASLYVAGRYPEAKVALGKALTVVKGKAAEPLKKLLTFVTKAIHGPDWSRVYESKSSHYHVYSDIDRKTCVDAARVLEDAHRCYRVHLKSAKRGKERFRVYLFRGEAGYLRYGEELFGEKPTNSAGLYVPSLRQLLIWNLPNRESMMRTVRHEGFHQYLHSIMPDAPRWFDEGHAEYYETAEYASGRWKIGLVRADHLETLREKGTRLPPLAKFLGYGYDEFYGKPDVNYAYAWALVHFLRHGPREYRTLLDALFERFQGKESPEKITKALLPDAKRAALEKAFREYLGTLGE